MDKEMQRALMLDAEKLGHLTGEDHTPEFLFDCEACAGQGWRPIESAPKDGTHILAYRMPVGIRVTTMTNPPAVVHWFDDGFYTSVNERAPEYPFNPTHWMPLPAPPPLRSVA